MGKPRVAVRDLGRDTQAKHGFLSLIQFPSSQRVCFKFSEPGHLLNKRPEMPIETVQSATLGRVHTVREHCLTFRGPSDVFVCGPWLSWCGRRTARRFS